MKGATDTEFLPEKELTRGMFAAMLARMSGENFDEYTKGKFDDVNSEMYYANPVNWAVDKGIITGYDEKTFAPDDNITREQAVVMIYRYAQYMKIGDDEWKDTNILSYDDFGEISEWAISSMQWNVGAGIIKGRTESTIAPTDNITRAEIAQMIMNFSEIK